MQTPAWQAQGSCGATPINYQRVQLIKAWPFLGPLLGIAACLELTVRALCPPPLGQLLAGSWLPLGLTLSAPESFSSGSQCPQVG